jgi:hypothetical protein
MIHDVSDPTSPERIAWWRNPDEAAFWTAQLAQVGEFFIASTHSIAGTERTALYTFPDRAGEQQDPPGAVVGPEEPLPSPPSTTASGANPTTATPTATQTAEPTTAEPKTPETDETAGETPGFGPVATTVALGLGAARLLRQRVE